MNRLLPLLVFYNIFLLTSLLHAQTLGCTDAQATNYNPNATQNDGSCVYGATTYAPISKTVLNAELAETSGLTFVGGTLWTHTDNGPQAYLYQIDTVTQATLKRVLLRGITVTDVEDVAYDGTYIYLGDIGNNSTGIRRDLRFWRFPASAIPSGQDVVVESSVVEEIRFTYPDQTDFSQATANKTAFDCEAFFVNKGQIHLFTKNWLTNETTYYTVSATPGSYVAAKKQTFAVNGLITAADRANNGNIALTGYNTANGAIFVWLLYDYPMDNPFGGNKRRIDLGSVSRLGQVEAIAFRSTGYAYLSNELFELNSGSIRIRVPATLWSFAVNDWVKTVKNKEVTEPTLCRNLSVKNFPLEFPVGTTSIHSVQGQLLWRGNNYEFNPSALPTGVYILTYSAPQFTCTKTVVLGY